MYFKEAIFEMKEGESFLTSNKFLFRMANGEICTERGNPLNQEQIFSFADLQGEIIQAEPSVMSVDDLWQWFWPDTIGTIDRRDFERLVEKCRENFELSMWMKFRGEIKTEPSIGLICNSLKVAVEKLDPRNKVDKKDKKPDN